MSAPINDGGPAFPLATSCGSNTAVNGMTLRDYLAARCPLTCTEFAELYGMPLPEILRSGEHSRAFWMLYTTERYTYADAMIAAQKEDQP